MKRKTPTLDQAIEAARRGVNSPVVGADDQVQKLAQELRELPTLPATLEDLYAVKTATEVVTSQMGGSPRGDELRKLAAELRTAGDQDAESRREKVSAAVNAAKALMLLRQRRGL